MSLSLSISECLVESQSLNALLDNNLRTPRTLHLERLLLLFFWWRHITVPIFERIQLDLSILWQYLNNADCVAVVILFEVETKAGAEVLGGSLWLGAVLANGRHHHLDTYGDFEGTC